MKWRFETDGIIKSIALDKNGTIYLSAWYLYAIDPNGDLLWRLNVGEGGCQDLVVKGSNLYVTTLDDILYSISTKGSEMWNISLTKGYSLSGYPLSLAIGHNGDIYVNYQTITLGDYIISINPNGSKNWNSKVSGLLTRHPVIGPDGSLYVTSWGSGPGYLTALNPNGEEKWKVDMEGYGLTPILGPDGTIYVATVVGNLYSISSEGLINWEYSCENSIEMPSVCSDNTIYFGLGEGKKKDMGSIIALSSEGEVKWKTELGNHEPNQPAIGSNGKIYVGTGRGFYALGKQTYSEFFTPGFEISYVVLFIVISACIWRKTGL